MRTNVRTKVNMQATARKFSYQFQTSVLEYLE